MTKKEMAEEIVNSKLYEGTRGARGIKEICEMSKEEVKDLYYEMQDAEYYEEYYY